MLPFSSRMEINMARPKKDGKVLNIKLASPTYDKLEKFCEEAGQTKTLAVERFLNKCLDEYFAIPESDRQLFPNSIERE